MPPQTSTQPPKIIICAAGKAKRWGNHKGSPKHLVNINGTPLIYRTIAQFQEHGQIVLMANDKRYGEITVPTDETVFSGTAMGQSRQFWSDGTNNLILFGDVYFSDAAVTTIIETPPDDVKFFGRLGRSPTGHGGELFGIMVPATAIGRVLEAIEHVKTARMTGEIDRHSGWEVFKQLNGFNLAAFQQSKYATCSNFVEINDETDDFDSPKEYYCWLETYNFSGEQK